MSENTSQNANVVVEHLRAWNGEVIEDVIEFRGETTVVVPREMLRERSPDGVFWDWPGDTEVMLARK